MLLKALLLQILLSIRSERQLVEAVNYNPLYRWFVGLNIEDKVWDHSTFSANRERLFNEDLARAFERVKLSAQWGRLASDEHFSVDGTLIEAWACTRVSNAKTTTAARHPDATRGELCAGQERCNGTHASTTDADARLFKKSGDKSRLCHMGHILMENRNGLIVDVEITHASGNCRARGGAKDAQTPGQQKKGHGRRRQGLRQQGLLNQGLSPALGHAARGGQGQALCRSMGASSATRATKPASKCASESRRPLAGSRQWAVWPRPN